MNSENGSITQTGKKNEEENKYKIFYSSYGYIQILEKDYNNNLLSLYKFTKWDNRNFLTGTIFKNNIKDNIDIRLKSFKDSRKIVSLLNLNINSKLNIVLENFTDKNINEKKITKYSQYRIYSCKTCLRELNLNSSFIENNLQDNELLLLFPEFPLVFSQSMKGKSIELSQAYRTAFKINTDDPQYVLGSIGYSSGRHYFEITLLTDPMIRSIVVGFSIKIDEKNLFTIDIQNFYGFILSDMKKTVFNIPDGKENLEDYGEVCNINDKIGVLYEFKEEGVSISFYKNRKNLGIAFDNLPNNLTYFPTVEMGFCGSKIQISNDIDFPDN
jgi:hypothetical protein